MYQKKFKNICYKRQGNYASKPSILILSVFSFRGNYSVEHLIGSGGFSSISLKQNNHSVFSFIWVDSLMIDI